ncbi:transporter [Sphingomonas jejuensis]|nr:transporter [Sphingomonas jejuensis]
MPSTGSAQALSPFCSDRPDRVVTPCVIEGGAVQLEIGAVDWARTRDGADRTDETLIADTVLRFGLGDEFDLRVGLSPLVRVRDVMGGRIEQHEGVGDLTVGLRRRIVDGGDDGVSFGLQLGATLPTGGDRLGQGDWSVEVVAPVQIPLGKILTLGLTPTVAAAADEDGDGRHFAWGGVAGIEAALGERVAVGTELYAIRNEEAGGATEATADAYATWRLSDGVQLDVAAYVGLNADTPDIELLSGITWRL